MCTVATVDAMLGTLPGCSRDVLETTHVCRRQVRVGVGVLRHGRR